MKKILVIDDEFNFITLLSETLKGAGYEVITAMDGASGLKKVHLENPDLILLDLLLPCINGYQVCSILKRDLRFQNIPIIILSARSEEDINIRWGDDDKPEYFFRKPFDSNALLVKIKELLDMVDRQKEEYQKKMTEQAEQWMKQRYIPGFGQSKGIFGT
jgi:two-component system alkaline phosphatase synthesis response regulator PhoP